MKNKQIITELLKQYPTPPQGKEKCLEFVKYIADKFVQHFTFMINIRKPKRIEDFKPMVKELRSKWLSMNNLLVKTYGLPYLDENVGKGVAALFKHVLPNAYDQYVAMLKKECKRLESLKKVKCTINGVFIQLEKLSDVDDTLQDVVSKGTESKYDGKIRRLM